MKLLEVASAQAETAEYRVNSILAEFRTRSESAASPDEELQAAYEAVHRLVTAAEMFAGEHLIDKAEQYLPEDELVQRLWDERSARIVRDWRGRREGWKDIFRLDWTYPTAERTELDAYITTRNIIAHGLGRLTRSQLLRGAVRPGVAQGLDSVGIRIRGLQLVISVTEVENCAQRIIHFVRWLDQESASLAAATAP